MSDAVLLMAYGSPNELEEVEAYYTHIRGGRTPSPERVAALRARYAAVGGRTPLLELTGGVAAGLEAAFARRGDARRVYVGMKHWHPFIGDTMRAMHADGVERVTAVALAPHYSRMSIGGYRAAVDAANRELGAPLDVRFVERWHDRPEFVSMMAELVSEGIAALPRSIPDPVAVFTAHSLPERIREWNDPYEAELAASAAAVAVAAGVERHVVAWQSAGETGEPWIGPDIVERLDALHDAGTRAALIVPIGFVADHLEILWDLDHVAIPHAVRRGMSVRRTRLPNVDARLVNTLAAVVDEAESVSQPSPA